MRLPTLVLAVALSTVFNLPNWVRAADSQATRNHWEPDIQLFEAADKTNPPPHHAILFVGSSSIRFWKNLQESFPGHLVFKRGFGGSEMSDSLAFADRIVIPYEPKLVLVYAGDNDVANGKSPERVKADFEAFVQKVHAALPNTEIGYIAIKPSLARRKLLDTMKAANLMIEQYARSTKGVLFIDVFTPMLTPEGSPRPELFVRDGLHLNEKGYALWASIINPLLDQYDPPRGKHS
ncbi:MAG TPA: SGNH/GDSL hydrolase family protein [Verrucomicrobiae bacterium]|nr:SGNH/GDSL hydrolase family protein [Verrucomicrobiae bacterium]